MEVINRRFLKVNDFQVLGKAYNVEEAIEKVHTLKPDIVILDVHLPGVTVVGCIVVISQR